MKKAVKILLGIAAAGASVSAAALAVKKYRDSKRKYVCDECDDDYFDEEPDDFDEEYHLTPEEEEELISTDDHDFGASDDDYYPGKYADISTAGKDNNDLLNGCVEDISDMVSENTPEDFWDFLEDYTKKKEDENDAE